MNNLYLISQSKNNGYDTYDSAVVVSDTEENAKLVHPSDCVKGYDKKIGFYGIYSRGKNTGEKYESINYNWCEPSDVYVEFIGTTEKELGTVVCSSFNAG